MPSTSLPFALEKAPIGVVTLEVLGRAVRLVDAAGADVTNGDGRAAVAVELVNEDGSVAERIPRNAQGGFWRLYQVPQGAFPSPLCLGELHTRPSLCPGPPQCTQANKWETYRKKHLENAAKQLQAAAA